MEEIKSIGSCAHLKEKKALSLIPFPEKTPHRVLWPRQKNDILSAAATVLDLKTYFYFAIFTLIVCGSFWSQIHQVSELYSWVRRTSSRSLMYACRGQFGDPILAPQWSSSVHNIVFIRNSSLWPISPLITFI